MSVELIVPTLGESISEATVSKWLKKIGEPFEVDEPLVEIETDKITVEVPAPQAGSLSEIKVEEGADINIGGVLGIIGDAKTVNKVESDHNQNSTIKKSTTIDKNNTLSNQDKKMKSKKDQFTNKLSPSVKKCWKKIMLI